MSDDTPKRMYSTLPPPEGADDLYSASTVVGPASPELLALVRAAQDGAIEKGAKPQGARHGEPASGTDEERLAAMKEAAARAAKGAVANEVARAAAKAASARPPSPSGTPAPPSAPPRVDTSPTAPPAPATAKTPEQARVTVGAVRPSERLAPRPGRDQGLPPALTIAMVFVATALVLAALVR